MGSAAQVFTACVSPAAEALDDGPPVDSAGPPGRLIGVHEQERPIPNRTRPTGNDAATDFESSAQGVSGDREPWMWDTFLDAFHREQPGITAEILGRSFADGITPYQWLTAAIPSTGTMIDVACGNAPLAALIGERWIGVDNSESELAVGQSQLARSSQPQQLVLGDASSLPLADGAVDIVVCSMALQVLGPLPIVLAELARVLRPGGLLVALVPARHPLTLKDRWRYIRLTRALHDGLLAPNDGELGRLAIVMGGAGFDVLDDEFRRFAYRLDDTTAAARFVSSLYVPHGNAERIDAANALARRWVGTSLGIPIRRFICIRTASCAASTVVSRS